MTVEFPFTSPSFSFPLAGSPSFERSHTQEQDQIMMDTSLALDPCGFGKIRCSSTCCHNLTQTPRKGILVNFFKCVLLLGEMCACACPSS